MAALRSFLSFDELRQGIGPEAAPGARAREVLRVSAELHAGDDRAAARTARAAVLDWAAGRVSGALPPEAARFEPFAVERADDFAEGVRVRGEGDDVWALRLVHGVGPAAGGASVTEVGVREQAGRLPEFRLRLLAEDSRADVPRVPDLVGQLASVLDLRRGGSRIVADPLVVESAVAASQLARQLLASERELPYLVMSVPEDSVDPVRPLLDPVAMARAVTGVALVVVLPAELTWTLSRTYGDRKWSVYLGAVRLYLPGFSLAEDPHRHRLILADWMTEPGGLERHRDELLRRIAAHSLEHSGEWSFADLRELSPAPKAPARSGPAAAAPAPDRGPAPAPSAEAVATVASEPRTPEAVAVRPTPARPPEPQPVFVETPRSAEPAAEEPAPAPDSATEESGPKAPEEPAPRESTPAALPGRLGRAWLALRGRPDPVVEAQRAQEREVWAAERSELTERLSGAERRVARFEKKLGQLAEEKDEFEGEWESAEQRADDAVAERDRTVRELQTLLEVLEERGISRPRPQALPTEWGGFADWCERELTGRVRLMPRARREIKRARFLDVELAARCLLWLGGEYRKLRLETTGLGLRGRVENGVHNQQCGGDAFPVKWRGRQQRVDWHIKSGGSTHDPTRCLRIYYFWDAASDEVVVASMPAHLRTDAT